MAEVSPETHLVRREEVGHPAGRSPSPPRRIQQGQVYRGFGLLLFLVIVVVPAAAAPWWMLLSR